ncbi:MAG: 4'-phosphopantetheinyl transferase superfamily protein [Betaproteobacteria bacterium]
MSLDEDPGSGNQRQAPHPRLLRSPSAQVMIWWCELDSAPARVSAYECLLSDAERQRASRFGHPRLRDRYVVGRGSLRTILGHELASEPAEVVIERGARGRPRLAGATRLDFNVSHTADVAIVGVVRAGRIGVDVERLDRAINTAGIARKFLTAAERVELEQLDTDTQRQRVLTLWTCKEAMSKATGDALSAPFAAIDVDANARRIRDGPPRYRPAQWALHPAHVPHAYVATIALWNTD